jgi:hypothetical protein
MELAFKLQALKAKNPDTYRRIVQALEMAPAPAPLASAPSAPAPPAPQPAAATPPEQESRTAAPAQERDDLDSSFVDETVPDGSLFRPGVQLRKVWTVENSGAIDWPKGTELVFVSGDRSLATQPRFPAPAAKAYQTVDVAAILQTGTAGHSLHRVRLACADPFAPCLVQVLALRLAHCPLTSG